MLPVRNLLAGDYVAGKEPKNTMDTCGGDSASQENSLTCAVCLSVFKDPKLLPCFHTFCALCIQDVADRYQGLLPLSCLPQAHLAADRGSCRPAEQLLHQNVGTGRRSERRALFDSRRERERVVLC